jgi:acetyltransferase-like isoleucine patch superfamily enzyme
MSETSGLASPADRPLRPGLRPLRHAVRVCRIWGQQFRLRDKLSVGSNVNFGARAVLHPPDRAEFGNNVYIGRDFYLETNLVVGSDVLISSRVAIVGDDHAFDDPAHTVFSQGRNHAHLVTLKGDNLIGFGTIIVGSVTIGRGCIVGAGAIVTRDLPANTVCVGVPATPLRARFQPVRPRL